MNGVAQMDDEWQPGDIALCIKQSRWRDQWSVELTDYGPKAGQVFEVKRVRTSEIPTMGLSVVLGFDRWPSDLFAAFNFMKLRPEGRYTGISATEIVSETVTAEEVR